VSGFASVARAVLRRNLIHAFKNPAFLIPSIVFPLVFLTANAGGLSSVGKVPGFDWTLGYTAFQFVFVFLQAAAFGGVFTGFAIAADFETGFGRRLLLAAPRREGLIAGYVGAALIRFAVTGTVVTVAALLAGMRVAGSPAQLLGLLSLAAASGGRRMLQARLALVALVALMVAVNVVPDNPYHLAQMQEWRQGRLLNFNALTHWLAMLWPPALTVGLLSFAPERG